MTGAVARPAVEDDAGELTRYAFTGGPLPHVARLPDTMAVGIPASVLPSSESSPIKEIPIADVPVADMPVADMPAADRALANVRITDMPTLLNGRYRIERLLGVGGMGAVYRARDLLREQFGDPSPLVAIKTLTDDFAAYPDAYNLLHSEFVLTLRLNHPNVVRLHGFEVDNAAQRAYVVLELLQGRTLDQALAEQLGGLPWCTARHLITDLLAAVAYAHERGVLHGDIKPSNIMLTPDGLRLFDFGLGQAQAGVLDGLPRISRDRFTAWTPRYAALELLEGNALSAATDVYAVACVIYELCTGKHPYRRLNAKQAKGLDLATHVSPPKDMPAHCWHALRSALSFDAADRICSAQDLARQFSASAPNRLSMWLNRLRFA